MHSTRRRRIYIVFCALTLLSDSLASQSAPVYPPKLSTSGSYLVDQAGRPFFINGEAAWSLIGQLSKPDAELYLENRRQKAFNVVLVRLTNHAFTTNAPANFYGDQPFSTPGDFNTPNEAYFAHADWVITTAAAKNQVVMLAPLYLGYQCGAEGWCAEIRNSSLSTMRNWGRYVGNRYKTFPNIVWVIGGDADAVAQGVANKVQEFITGLQEFDTTHLMTVHNGRHQSGASVWPNAAWLTLNSVYTDAITYTQAAQEYNRVPRKPSFLVESYYENEHASTPLSLRSQAYWAVLSGAVGGHIFGNCPINNFDAATAGCPSRSWRTEMNSIGSSMIVLVGSLFNSRAFYDLVPDLNHQVLLTGYQSGTTYATAARTSNGSTVLVYIPTQRAITIDMTKIAGTTARMWWYNPRTGGAMQLGDFPTTGTQTLTPPDANDWVLVADNALLNLPAPGSNGFAGPPAAPTDLRIVQ
jgi:hypothetical protein